jgi:hypothetical protein
MNDEQKVDIGVRRQLASAVSAHGNDRYAGHPTQGLLDEMRQRAINIDRALAGSYSSVVETDLPGGLEVR